jgi:hypothetical protein
MISGQVVDAETGRPIEGAAIYILWTKQELWPPGLAEEVRFEQAETLTDSEGRFKVPKYYSPFKKGKITVYKNGYVCWNSWKIFPDWRERKGFKLKNKMKIGLERFKEEYSKEAHAHFTTLLSIGCKKEFRKAINMEEEINRYYIRKKKNESEEKK